MNKSRILSTFRVEFRRKGASYRQERTALRWIQKFLDTFTIDHSSQIRHWQCDFFISELKKEDYTFDDLLQARSALRFMMKRVLSRTAVDDTATHDSSGVIRITAQVIKSISATYNCKVLLQPLIMTRVFVTIKGGAAMIVCIF